MEIKGVRSILKMVMLDRGKIRFFRGVKNVMIRENPVSIRG